MTEVSPESPLLRQVVDPWFAGLAEPAKTQEETLKRLLEGYSRTEYGQDHDSGSVEGIADFRSSFPVSTYKSLSPYIAKVRRGEDGALLSESLKRWVMTRGTTGASKVLPVGETHLSEILTYGARCVVNFALTQNIEVIETPVLNLNFPSEVHQMDLERGGEPYGYSSGTYAKFNPEFGGAKLIPRQEEIDIMGGGVSKEDWEKRYELAFQKARGTDIGSLMGVTPVILGFGSYVKRKHGVRPKEIWNPRALFCTSVAKIHTKYKPILQHLYGHSPVEEMYTATEGVFAQQRDELPYVSPNYDGYLFEVMNGRETKMLHELKRNEWGRLLVSTSILPRYDIGDLVEAMGKGYFRIFGRNRFATRAEHLLFNLLAFRF